MNFKIQYEIDNYKIDVTDKFNDINIIPASDIERFNIIGNDPCTDIEKSIFINNIEYKAGNVINLQNINKTLIEYGTVDKKIDVTDKFKDINIIGNDPCPDIEKSIFINNIEYKTSKEIDLTNINIYKPNIFILIRCCYRPNYFKQCIETIINQTYKNITIIISYDDENCLEYLNEYINNYENNNLSIQLFKVEKDISKDCFYNLYCNELLNKVPVDKNNWIMFLDDDDKFQYNTALENIISNINSSNDFIFWKFIYNDGNIIGPNNYNELQCDIIANSTYLFNSIYKNYSSYELTQIGDFEFIKKFKENTSLNLNFKYLQEPFTGTQNGHNEGKDQYNQKGKKISIVMAYYNRKEQTILTLNQFERLYANKYNFEVIIVDDCSEEKEKLNDIINNYSCKIKYIELKNKNWINPVVPFNIAINNIDSESNLIIFQNPETFHCKDILNHANNIKFDEYFVYPVYNSPSYEENDKLKLLFQNNCDNYFNEFINKIDYTKYKGEWDDRVINEWKGWLQHKEFNDRQLHFLTAISKVALDKVGGFCNEMKDGLWYDDDDFLNRIKKVTSVISIESYILIGIHQKHSGGSNENMKTQKAHELRKKNIDIFNKNIENNIIYCNPKLDIKYTINKNIFNNDLPTIIYYSKTNYNLLFQRPHQIMRFFNFGYNKVFIGEISSSKYENKYNLYISPYKEREIILKLLNNNTIIYYTDPRLYDEVDKLPVKKLFDLIDAPIDEFKVWKPNLEKCVKNSDYVIYSHPNLVNFLNEIDNTKQYTYISNACDYKHFSSAKDRIGERPNDFPQNNKPILGYYGAFSEWLDYDIIRKYADNDNYHIVMIGGIPENASYNMRFKHSNITWLDHKPYDELPYYLSWFDKCFLPFKDCELTKYVNPCKLWEYMASEKEIIKFNVNMDVNEIVTYDDVCEKIHINIINKSSVGTFEKYSEKHEKYIKIFTDIFIIAPYPYDFKLKEGYIKRINFIFNILNKLFTNICFIFFSNQKYPEIAFVSDRYIELRVDQNINSDFIYNLIKNKKIHIETTHGCQFFYENNLLNKINFSLDIHGATPEEEEFLNNKGYLYWNKIEYESILNANIIICVSEKMLEHLENKHKLSIKNKNLTIGISNFDYDLNFLNSNLNDFIKKSEYNFDIKKNNIVYSGGTQKWQNIDYIINNLLGKTNFNYNFFSHDKYLLIYKLKNINKLQFVSNIENFTNIEDLRFNYKLNIYGLLLRDNIIVNSVSCPTKLCDYIIDDLVPVIFDNNLIIGDFKDLKYIFVDDLQNNINLTLEEYKNIIIHNKKILIEHHKYYLSNIEKLQKMII